MALTAQQISDLRADLGDVATPPVFTDADLERAWERVSGAKDETQRHEAALGLLARQLLTSAAKLHDYAAGQSREDVSQVFEHLRHVYELYRPALQAALHMSLQWVIGGVRGVENPEREEPRS